MQLIRKLPKDVISKISAGEVIERPSYAVKELIENAIDAHADTIHIEIKDSGLSSIIVSDNGDGMVREDLLICFSPHTTSKISSGENLIGVKTLGFRGEALHSIAAISDMTIRSRYRGDIGGTKVVVQNGELNETGTVGMSQGTSIKVEHLFSSMPVRKKFLKSLKTEFRHISDVVSNFALSYPTIQFTLVHNGKIVFDFSKSQDIAERVRFVLGETLYENMIHFRYKDDIVTIEGFLAKPQSALKHNLKQYLFVNGRAVSDKLISLAGKEAYGTLLPQSDTPVFVLFLTLPWEVVDVNVHPRKSHVAFANSKSIFDAVKQAITNTLVENNLTFRLSKFKHETSARLGETETFAGKVLKKEVVKAKKKTLGNVLSSMKPVMQLLQTYILLEEDDEGIVLVDQHAAHERVLYEDFVEMFEKQRKTESKKLLQKPLTFTLSLSDSQIFDEFEKDFISLGFDIEHFSGTGIIIRSYPSVFIGRNIQRIILDMLADFHVVGSASDVDTKSKRMLSFLACRAAVTAGDPLTPKQMKTLLADLNKTKNNTTCPHGRPTHIQIPYKDIHKWFQRS